MNIVVLFKVGLPVPSAHAALMVSLCATFEFINLNLIVAEECDRILKTFLRITQLLISSPDRNQTRCQQAKNAFTDAEQTTMQHPTILFRTHARNPATFTY